MIDWSLLQGAAAPGATPAPALAMPAPSTVTAGLDQSEWIQYDDLANLAGRLVKQKSEHHQRIGRTISRMLRGELYAAPEPRARNQTLYQVAGEILEAYPFCSPDSVVEHFTISIERMAEETNASNPGNPAPTLAEFRAMLVRHQGPKQGKHATISEAMAAIDAYAARADAPQGIATLPTPALAAADSWGAIPEGAAVPGEPPAPVATPAELAGLDRRSLIVRVSDSMFLMRHPAAATYDLKVSSPTGVRIELQRRFVDAGLPLDLVDDDGDMLPLEKIFRSYAMNAHATVYDYTTPSTTFDQRSALVRIGIAMGRLPDLRIIEPEHSDAVELWLYTLVGGNDDALIDLYDWIASTDQQHIGHAAAALVLQGPPSIGKSQFARGLAMTWGSSEPVAMSVALDRFNGALTRCPIWFADEHMPKDLDQSTFRRLVQDQERNVEFKGQERGLLIGSSRMAFAVNDLRDIAIGANGANQDAIRATAGRLAIHESCNEATCVQALLAIAQGRQSEEKQIIARHMRSIQLTEQPKPQRFYGARDINEGVAQGHLLSSTFARQQTLASGLAEYLTDPLTWEKQYNHNAPQDLGLRFPVYVGNSSDWVMKKVLRICPTELTARVGLPVRDVPEVRKALQPFVVGKTRRSHGPVDGRFRGYYLEVDAKMLCQALDVEPTAMTKTTETRRREVGLTDD